MRMLIKIFLTLTLSIATYLAHADADEGALYSEGAPPGSAFIRIFNGFPGKIIDNADLGGKKIARINALESSSYVFLPAGKHTITIFGKTQTISMDKGEFRTVVFGDGFLPTIIKDATFDNRRKALIGLYNLASKDELNLKTAEGDITIIEGVNFLENKAREINPVRLAVSVTTENSPLGKTKSTSLERGKVFSIFACGDKISPKLVWVESKIDTTL